MIIVFSLIIFNIGTVDKCTDNVNEPYAVNEPDSLGFDENGPDYDDVIEPIACNYPSTCDYPSKAMDITFCRPRNLEGHFNIR